MKLSDSIQRQMARIYLRYVSPFFCFLAAIALAFGRPEQQSGKRLLVLKPDAIGDYILFRNFLSLLRKSEKYRDHHITFCGNSAYSSFALHFDHDAVDEFIWLDKNRIYLNVFYYIRVARLLRNRYSETIHASRSRELIFDYYAKISSPGDRTTHNGDTVNILSIYKSISDHWYTRIIHSGDIYSFEFDANRKFFETLLNQSIPIDKPFLEKLPADGMGLDALPQKFAALFPGAQLPFRRWSTGNFAAVCDFLKEKYDLDIVILGGQSDHKLAIEIMRKSKGKISDLTGKTPLVHLPAVIAQAKILITNDTMAVHIGAAMGVPTVVVSQMNHYGRFVPYPKEKHASMECVIPPAFLQMEASAVTKRFRNGSGVDISLVRVNQVQRAIENLLNLDSHN
ncbi:MAG: glycosyltransferase family 9 protein [Bacteroidales bacterium]